MAATNNSFLPQQGAYKQLIVFRLSTCIYTLTYAFAHRYFSRGDRTIDQMVQAARSGKQNIAEGSVAATTSREMELKLTNVAKASMHELLLDYEDYLMTHHLQQWSLDDPRIGQTRAFCRKCLDETVYQQAVETRSAETIANIAITILHQFDVLITALIERQKQRFLREGGIKEQMYRARKGERK